MPMTKVRRPVSSEMIGDDAGEHVVVVLAALGITVGHQHADHARPSGHVVLRVRGDPAQCALDLGAVAAPRTPRR